MKKNKKLIIILSIITIIFLGLYISFGIMLYTDYKWLDEHTMPFGTKVVDIKSDGWESTLLDNKGNIYIIGHGYELIKYYGVKSHESSIYSWYDNKDFVSPIKVNENASEIIDNPNGIFWYKDVNNNIYSLTGELEADDSIKMVSDGYMLTKEGKVITKENDEYIELIDNIRFITTGEYKRVLVIDNNDVLYSWDDNEYGQRYQSNPPKILENVDFVKTNSVYTIAVTKNHDLYIWGRNYFEYSIINSYRPKKIASNVIDADVGDGYIIYYTDDNKIMYVGDELFEGSIRAHLNEPYVIMTGDVKTLEATSGYFFILLTDGTIFTCGDGYKNNFWNTNNSFDIDNPIKIWDPKWDENSPKYEYYKNE